MNQLSIDNQHNFLEDILLAHKIINSGVPNRFGCRIPLRTRLNIPLFTKMLENYEDNEVVDWLKYGFTISRDQKEQPLMPSVINHKGATQYPATIKQYLEKEIQLGATMGPFTIPPFLQNIGVSPLNTRPKRESNERRVILDLSYPFNCSVNDGINKNLYFGEEIKLVYPTIDDMARRVALLGSTCLLWKRDLSRFFRQVPLCPGDWSYIGMRWQNLLFFDKFFPMGLRSAAYCCQRVTNSITYMHQQQKFWCINYLDDFSSAEKANLAWWSFWSLGLLLQKLGIQEAMEKACPPSHRMEFLGNIVDSQKMTLEVSEKRLQEISVEINDWIAKQAATRKQLESIIGKLSFISNCVRAGRVFISRLLNQLSGFPQRGHHQLNSQMKKDFIWWQKFLSQYNGVSILWLTDTLGVDILMATDACLTAAGATCDGEYMHALFPPSIKQQFKNIAHLELIAILVSVRLWVNKLRGKVIHLSCDNQACVNVVNSGRAWDHLLQKCLRELMMELAANQIWLKLIYINTKANTLPDLLSRWYNQDGSRRKFKSITNNAMRRRSVSSKLFTFDPVL